MGFFKTKQLGYLMALSSFSMILLVNSHGDDDIVGAGDPDHSHGGHSHHNLTEYSERAAKKELICSCDPVFSKMCTVHNTCNAFLVAKKLKEGLKMARVMVDEMKTNPGMRAVAAPLCSAMKNVQNLTDIQILDFETWEPACVRAVDTNISSCSLAPATLPVDYHSIISKAELNGKLKEFYQFLSCEPPMEDQIESDWIVCRNEHECNDGRSPVYRPFFSTDNSILMYSIIPAIIILVLIMTAITVCLVKRCNKRRNQYYKRSPVNL